MDYRNQMKVISHIKTWVIGFLLVLLSAGGVFTVMNMREGNRYQELYLHGRDSWDEFYIEFTNSYNSMMDELLNKRETISLETIQIESIGQWEYYTVTAYTSRDEGVNTISSIGFDIGKWDMYFDFCASALGSYADYGDTLLIKMPDGTIQSFMVVDTGGGLVVGDTDKAEIDLYFGDNVEAAFAFGKQRLEIWVVKNDRVVQ